MTTPSRIKAYLPEPVVQWAREYRNSRTMAAHTRNLETMLRGAAADRYRTVEPGAVASTDVISRTALMTASELEQKSKQQVFLAGGRYDLHNLLAPAISAGLDLRTATAVFELGCGGARLLRHLRSIEGLELVGSDLIAENVEWCREHLPGIAFHRNDLEPPLVFARDETFDFVLAYSVFTHIPFELQGPWVAELARILKPGGVASVTVLGQEMADVMMNAEDMEAFHRDGYYTMGPDHPRVSESSRIIGSWDVFMTEEVLHRVYGAHLEVVHRSAAGQSIVTLRKPV